MNVMILSHLVILAITFVWTFWNIATVKAPKLKTFDKAATKLKLRLAKLHAARLA